jgi:restriction system protein
MAMEPRAWLARAGSDGRHERLALDNDLVAIGWGELGDLTALSREALAKRIRSEYPEAGKGKVSNWTGQLSAFLHGFQVGDLVVLPLKTRPMIAIGRIAGDYVYRPDFDVDARHTRPVRWIRKDVPRTAVGQDLLYSLGAFMTVCRVSRHDAAQRLAALAETGADPGYEGADLADASADAATVESENGIARDNLERDARDAINQVIAARFAGHELSTLVAAILEAQGMTTYVAPAGKDGGIDVMAGSGPLGMDSPRICVQVKFTKDPVSASVIRELDGVAGRVGAQQCLLVSWSGITSDAEREIRNLFFRIRVWDADALFRELTAVYDQLPEELQVKLPLKRIWTLAVKTP